MNKRLLAGALVVSAIIASSATASTFLGGDLVVEPTAPEAERANAAGTTATISKPTKIVGKVRATVFLRGTTNGKWSVRTQLLRNGTLDAQSLFQILPNRALTGPSFNIVSTQTCLGVVRSQWTSRVRLEKLDGTAYTRWTTQRRHIIC